MKSKYIDLKKKELFISKQQLEIDDFKMQLA